jgi:ABC-type phosphate transport system ATPase subunit
MAWSFQKPNPFPKTIYDNVAFGARQRISGQLGELVERSLRQAALGRGERRSQEVGLALSGVSSNACASPARWPFSPTSSSWTSRVRPWTR